MISPYTDFSQAQAKLYRVTQGQPSRTNYGRGHILWGMSEAGCASRCKADTCDVDIRGCMCSAGPFQYRWLKGYIYSSWYYHHQIESIHLSHCYHIFPWLCTWDVCYIIFCHLLHTRSGKTGNLFSLSLCSLWWVQIFGYVLACRSHSFVCTVHHLIIIIVQTYLKALNL